MGNPCERTRYQQYEEETDPRRQNRLRSRAPLQVHFAERYNVADPSANREEQTFDDEFENEHVIKQPNDKTHSRRASGIRFVTKSSSRRRVN